VNDTKNINTKNKKNDGKDSLALCKGENSADFVFTWRGIAFCQQYQGPDIAYYDSCGMIGAEGSYGKILRARS